MSIYARWKEPGVPEIFTGSQDVIADGVHHPRNIVTLWTPAALKKIGLLPFDAASVPSGHTVDTRTYEEVAGRIVESVETTPPPPPTPEEILESRARKLDSGRLWKALVRAGDISKTNVPADQLDALNALAAIDKETPL